MKTVSVQENLYFAYHFLAPNKWGFTHILQDKKKDEWLLVHPASLRGLPIKDGSVLIWFIV